MKKTVGIILKSTSFLLAFFILLNVFSFVFTPKDGKVQGSVYCADSYKAEKNNTIDIFFAGNSNVASSVIPPVIWEKTGYTACISGKANQSLGGAYKTIKDMYKTQNPAVVVIETDMVFAGQGKKLSRSYINDQLINIKRIISVVFKNFEDSAMSGMSYYFPVFKHHERWNSLSLQDLTHTEQRCKSQYLGYTADFTVNGCDKNFNNYMKTREDASIITADREKELKKIIKLCHDKGSKVIFLDVPCASSWSMQRHKEMSAFARKTGIDFIDMNVTLPEGFNWNTDTKDMGTHLNTFGAQKVSEFICEYLSTHIGNNTSQSFNNDEWKKTLGEYQKEYQTMCNEVKL